MTPAGPNVFDATDADFEQSVLLRSSTTPVLVDFWAAWCAPCRSLGPVLEALAVEANGRFVLAKVDTEQNPGLARVFGIQSIPLVVLIQDGKPIGEFTGALPEAEIRRFLDQHLPGGEEDAVAAADRLIADGDLEGARDRLGAALASDAEHPGVHLRLARIALAEGSVEEAARHARTVPEEASEFAEARAILEGMHFAERCAAAGGEAAVAARVKSSPEDLAALYDLGCCAAAAGRHEEALEHFLAIVRRDMGFQEGAARKAMVTIFGIVGQRSELADRYRKQLAMMY